MSITITCPACHRSFSVDDRLAGKRGKCKSCGGPIRVPEPAAAGPNLADIYGLDDDPVAPAFAPAPDKWSGLGAAAEGPSPLPGRAGGFGPGKPKRKKGGEGWAWEKGVRQAACTCLFLGMIVIRMFLRAVPAEYKTHPAVSLLSFATMALMAVGVLLTVLSLGVAVVSFVSGNSRAFAGDTTGDRLGWFSACILSAILIVGFGYGITHPSRARPPQGPWPGGGGVPGGFPGGPPAAGGQPAVPPFGAGQEIRSDVRVTLSNGRFMRSTTPIGTARPGVEISVDYQIDGGDVAGPEQLVLVIESARGRGELDNLNEMRMRRSGTVHASSFMASPDQGPYQAWVEVATMPGPLGQRKKVSSPVALQFTDVPVRDPAAEARAAMEEQQRRMMAPPQMQPMGPRFPQPGQMPPMGPRGPRGGNFGPGQR